MRRLCLLGLVLALVASCTSSIGGSSQQAGTQPVLSPMSRATATAMLQVTATRTPFPSPTFPSPGVPGPTPTCESDRGRVERIAYPGVALQDEIPVRVYLPPCYDAVRQGYPTLYLLHGKPYNESHWDDLGADEVADAAIMEGAWPPFLIVMPLQPEPLFSSTDGGQGSYEVELLEGLVPFIDRTYHTNPLAEARALAGISRGGVWALEIALRNPDAFGGVAALSPALAVNHPREEFDPFRIVLLGGPHPNKIYLSAGETDWARPETERLSQTMTMAGIVHTLVISPGGHDSTYWKSALVPVFDFLVTSW